MRSFSHNRTVCKNCGAAPVRGRPHWPAFRLDEIDPVAKSGSGGPARTGCADGGSGHNFCRILQNWKNERHWAGSLPVESRCPTCPAKTTMTSCANWVTGSKKHLKPLKTRELGKRRLSEDDRFLASQIFMNFRGPKALGNRRRKAIVLSHL